MRQNHFDKELVNLDNTKMILAEKVVIRICELYFEQKKIVPTKRTRFPKNIPTLTSYSPGTYSYTEICLICDFENEIML